MNEFFTYMLQANILFTAFFVLYKALLAGDTFLSMRRLCLFFMPLGILILPLIRFSTPENIVEHSTIAMIYVEAIDIVAPVAASLQWGWQEVWLSIWLLGVVGLSCCFLYRLYNVISIIRNASRIRYAGEWIYTDERIHLPCSFFTYLFLNPKRYDDSEVEDIIRHERIHMDNWHSLDIIWWQLIRILFWFNPIVWMLLREVRYNLEFLADRGVLRTGIDQTRYQYLLLHLSCRETAVTLMNNFNVSQLKKRIMMMNRKRTNRLGLLKYLGIMPLVLFAMVMTDVYALDQPVLETLLGKQRNERSELRGRIVDENGEPLQGASIVIKGESVGTISDKDGEFILKGYSRGMLCFSYIGRETQIIYCVETGNANREIILPMESQEMEKIVVVGYGTPVREKAPDSEDKTKEIFTVVEDMPVFSEGSPIKYIARNIKYPTIAIQNGIEGTVYVEFVILSTGKIDDIKIRRSVDPSLDKEAVRIISGMPDWKPGMQRGKPVAVSYTLPISFNLREPVKKEPNDK